MLKNLTKIAAILSVLIFSTMAKAADPIRIPVLIWSSQVVMAKVIGVFLVIGSENEVAYTCFHGPLFIYP
jgi:hypothetical protein